jgi:large subunit ribosomal protein L32
MGVPKKKTTQSRRNKRRSHHHIEEASLCKCSNCGEIIKPYTICPSCGYYKKSQFIKKEEV